MWYTKDYKLVKKSDPGRRRSLAPAFVLFYRRCLTTNSIANRMPRLLAMLFVLLGLLELRRTGTSVYGELVVAGLTLGMLGDLLLALRYLGQKLHHFFFAAGFYAYAKEVRAGKVTPLGAVYIASVLFMTACAATGAFISSSRALFLFFVGGVCFSASDNMLVVLSFGKDDSPYRNAVLHVLYYMAQIFIALTIEFA